MALERHLDFIMEIYYIDISIRVTVNTSKYAWGLVARVRDLASENASDSFSPVNHLDAHRM